MAMLNNQMVNEVFELHLAIVDPQDLRINPYDKWVISYLSQKVGEGHILYNCGFPPQKKTFTPMKTTWSFFCMAYLWYISH